MSVSNVVGLNQGVARSDWRSSVHQARQDFDQLFQSLQAGNLGAAQQAYGAFQQVQAGISANGQAASGTANSAVSTDWSALGQALQSGSLSSAQDAMGKLQQDAQAAWQSQFQQQAQNAQSVYALMQNVQGTSAAAGTGQATSSVQGDLNALNQALQAGDTSGAQKLLAQLEQDLQASGQTRGHHHHHHRHGGMASAAGTSAYTGATAATDTTSSKSATSATSATTAADSTATA